MLEKVVSDLARTLTCFWTNLGFDIPLPWACELQPLAKGNPNLGAKVVGGSYTHACQW